jgi:hypothetical protein
MKARQGRRPAVTRILVGAPKVARSRWPEARADSHPNAPPGEARGCHGRATRRSQRPREKWMSIHSGSHETRSSTRAGSVCPLPSSSMLSSSMI